MPGQPPLSVTSVLLTAGVVYDVATHIVQLCSVPTNETLLLMLSLLYHMISVVADVGIVPVVSLGDPSALSH